MTSSFGCFFSRATILRASSNGQACDCSASARKFGASSAISTVIVCFSETSLRAKQSNPLFRCARGKLDCFVAIASLNDDHGSSKYHHAASKRADREIAQPQVG